MIFAKNVIISHVDFPDETCSTIFTVGCNMHCNYCHNVDLARGRVLTADLDEIFKKLKKNKKLFDAVTITGGEPTIHNSLPQFIRLLKEEGFLIKLDTNGFNPAMLETILDQGCVSYVAMDIKTSFSNYLKLCTIPDIEERIKKSIACIIQKARRFEFRTTPTTELNPTEFFVEVGDFLQSVHVELVKEHGQWPGFIWYLNQTNKVGDLTDQDIYGLGSLRSIERMMGSTYSAFRFAIR